MDTSTVINLDKLPPAKIRKGCHIDSYMGSCCFLDPPGYPSYFIQHVYTPAGNKPATGHTRVLLGRGLPERPDLSQFYQALPIDHPRVRAWIRALYNYCANCYHLENLKDLRASIGLPGTDTTILIYPIPYYGLAHFTDDPRYSDEYRESEIARVKARNDQIEKLLAPYAVPENHKAVNVIRQFYPEYQPELELITNPPTERIDNSWERA